MATIEWSDGQWLNEPLDHRIDGGALVVSTGQESDFWRETGYGFTHHSGHALLADFPADSAMEVEFSADWAREFDQAGLFMYADDENWIKAGVEFADGVLGLGAVVTATRSDWSVGHVPEWMQQPIQVRVSRSRDAITVRARTPQEAWRMVRLAPIDPALTWRAGPLAASPTGAELKVTFSRWRRECADAGIHHN